MVIIALMTNRYSCDYKSTIEAGLLWKNKIKKKTKRSGARLTGIHCESWAPLVSCGVLLKMSTSLNGCISHHPPLLPTLPSPMLFHCDSSVTIAQDKQMARAKGVLSGGRTGRSQRGET